jgi:hypothetical protein
LLKELQNDQKLYEKADEQLGKPITLFRKKHGVTDSVYQEEQTLGNRLSKVH